MCRFKFKRMKKLNLEQIKRIKKLKSILWILLVGFAYFVWVKITKISIPCVFYVLTHKYCPGCGITRMVIALAKFDFKAAFKCNAFVLSFLPFLCAVLLYKTIMYVKTGKTEDPTVIKIFYVVAFVFSVAFWILRNLPQFSWLTP